MSFGPVFHDFLFAPWEVARSYVAEELAQLRGHLNRLSVEVAGRPTPLSGTKVYWVSDTNGGATNRKLTFTDGVLTAET